MTNYSELEQIINKLLLKIGTISLIKHLYEFEKNFDYKKEKQFKDIQEIIIDYFDVSENDIVEKTTRPGNDTVNAKRCIVYFLRQYTSIPGPEICKLVGIKQKSYRRYLNYVKEVKEEKNKDIEFSKAINDIDFILKEQKNGQ